MDSGGPEELARLRRNLLAASADQLEAITIATLDEMIDLVRAFARGNPGVEAAAAVSAELHRRRQSNRPTYAATVGNA
jgi:hypothetical protein